MALKPERAYPNLENDRRRIADKNAGLIERYISQVAHDFYGNNYKLERFTEIRWNAYVKKSFFESLISKEETSLFFVEIGYMKVKEVTEICLYIEFKQDSIEFEWQDGFDKNENSREKVIQCCNKISAETGLMVELRMGRGLYSSPRYIRP